MPRPESAELSDLEDALAALSYIPEAVGRFIRRSQHHLTAEDVRDLLTIFDAAKRTKGHLGRLRERESTVYQKGGGRG